MPGSPQSGLPGSSLDVRVDAADWDVRYGLGYVVRPLHCPDAAPFTLFGAFVGENSPRWGAGELEAHERLPPMLFEEISVESGSAEVLEFRLTEPPMSVESMPNQHVRRLRIWTLPPMVLSAMPR